MVMTAFKLCFLIAGHDPSVGMVHQGGFLQKLQRFRMGDFMITLSEEQNENGVKITVWF